MSYEFEGIFEGSIEVNAPNKSLVIGPFDWLLTIYSIDKPPE